MFSIAAETAAEKAVWPSAPGIRAVYPLIRARARLNHVTKSFHANADKAKSWEKGNGRLEELRLALFKFAGHAPLPLPAEWSKG
jgi:hypothetical protein